MLLMFLSCSFFFRCSHYNFLKEECEPFVAVFFPPSQLTLLILEKFPQERKEEQREGNHPFINLAFFHTTSSLSPVTIQTLQASAASGTSAVARPNRARTRPG